MKLTCITAFRCFLLLSGACCLDYLGCGSFFADLSDKNRYHRVDDREDQSRDHNNRKIRAAQSHKYEPTENVTACVSQSSANARNRIDADQRTAEREDKGEEQDFKKLLNFHKLDSFFLCE